MDDIAYEVNAANLLVLQDVEAKAIAGLPNSMTIAGRRMLEMVRQAMAASRLREEKAEAIARKALEQLKLMRDRNRELEARIVQAEAQARASELWIRRLHVELENELGSIETDVFVQPLGEPRKAA